MRLKRAIRMDVSRVGENHLSISNRNDIPALFTISSFTERLLHHRFTVYYKLLVSPVLSHRLYTGGRRVHLEVDGHRHPMVEHVEQHASSAWR